MKLKDLAQKKERLTSGHRMCAGCAAPTAVRQILMATDDPVVVSCATGCLEVSTTIYPSTAWDTPFIHSAFENSAATMSGVEAAYQSLKRQGKIDKDIKFLAFGGDGGSYDIGLQSLSGAMERGHDMVYVCYDNGAYMNTGIQRSSSTPLGAWTTTSETGKAVPGKKQSRKDLTACIAAHNIPYVAQGSPAFWKDLTSKAKTAFDTPGAAFLNVIAPCPRGWRHSSEISIGMARLAVDTCFWPLYEVIDGEYKLNYMPKEKKPFVEWLKPQGRFKHLFTPENDHIIEALQAGVDKNWERILKLSGQG